MGLGRLCGRGPSLRWSLHCAADGEGETDPATLLGGSAEAHEEADRPCWKSGQGLRVIQRDRRQGRQHLLPERACQERSIRLRQRLEHYRAELEGGGPDAPLLRTASLH